LSRNLIKIEQLNYRIGQGFDTHQLELDTPLIIGGVSIPFHKGSKGHSDGDVLFHAIVDALLGAISEGDIGTHFPSNDVLWKGAESKTFLSHAFSLVKSYGYEINNIDSTIILQEPHVSSFIPKMKSNISKILNIKLKNISVKATTTDYLGFVGRGEGISASSIILLKEKNEH